MKVTSHNIRASSRLLEEYADWLLQPANATDIVLCQDIGVSSVSSIRKLKSLHPSLHCLFSFCNSNNSRSVAILAGPAWSVLRITDGGTGAFLGVILGQGDRLLAVASAYLPPGLDLIGYQANSMGTLSARRLF